MLRVHNGLVTVIFPKTFLLGLFDIACRLQLRKDIRCVLLVESCVMLFCETKITKFNIIILVKKYILGLQISMNQSQSV